MTERDQSRTQDATDAQQRPGKPTHEKIHDSWSPFSILEVFLCASAFAGPVVATHPLRLREFIL
jgi:hypothetical protein